MRENRIKEFDFSTITPTGSPFNGVVYSQAINGEVLAVNWDWDNTGSIWIAVSGTEEEVFRRNAPSGASLQFAYPRLFTQSTTGSIAGALHQPFVVNAPLMLVASGCVSGTLALAVNVRYR